MTETLYLKVEQNVQVKDSHVRLGEIAQIFCSDPAVQSRVRALKFPDAVQKRPGRYVHSALELVELTDTGSKKFKNFSLGMKQRLGLALALMSRPEFLLLDEPINGLDPEGVAQFRALFRRLNQERQTTILISSHVLSELSAVATCYGFLERGRLLEEITAQALRERCQVCLRLQVDDAAKASVIFHIKLGTDAFKVLPDNTLELYDHLDCPQVVSQALAEEGVFLQSMERRGSDLETYFLDLIGGGQNA